MPLPKSHRQGARKIVQSADINAGRASGLVVEQPPARQCQTRNGKCHERQQEPEEQAMADGELQWRRNVICMWRKLVEIVGSGKTSGESERTGNSHFWLSR